jgi:uncharacterized membrane protein
LIWRNTCPANADDAAERSIPDAGEEEMSNAANAGLWTLGFFCLSFAAIFVFWLADHARSRFLGKP